MSDTLHPESIPENRHEQRDSTQASEPVIGRRSFLGKIMGIVGGVATGGLALHAGVEDTQAEEDAVKRSMEARRDDHAGNTETVQERIERAEEQNASARDQYNSNNRSFVEKGRDSLISEIVLSSDIYRDTVGPLLVNLVKELGVMKTVMNKQLEKVKDEAETMKRDKETIGADSVDADGVKEWIADAELEAQKALEVTSKISSGVSDVIIALNALEAVLYRAPRNLQAGRIGKIIENLAVNIPILVVIIKQNFSQYIRSDDTRTERNIAGRVKKVKEAAKTAGARVNRSKEDVKAAPSEPEEAPAEETTTGSGDAGSEVDSTHATETKKEPGPDFSDWDEIT